MKTNHGPFVSEKICNCAYFIVFFFSFAMLFVSAVGHKGHKGHEGHKAHEGARNGMHGQQNLVDEKHIREHLEGEIDLNDTQWKEKEIEFYYFKLHDTNNDTHLDGLEILKSFVHMYIDHNNLTETDSQNETKGLDNFRDTLQTYTESVDEVMDNHDLDNDGYISYPEFILARTEV